MNPNRVDSLVDLSYGLLIFAAVALMVVVGTQTGIAFGLGVLVSYALHVVWKMGRFDPEWMTREVAQRVEEDLSEDVTESVEQSVTETVEESVAEDVAESVEESVAEDVAESVEANIAEDVAKNVEESVADQVSDTVEETISEEVEDVREKVEEVNERVDRRPRTDEVEAAVEGTADEDSADEKPTGE